VWQRINVINGEMIFNRPKMWLGYDIENGQRLEKNVYADSIIQGRDLTPGDQGTTRCLVSEQIAEEYKVGLGDELSINGFPHEIVGVYRTGSLLLDVAVVVDINEVRRMTGFPADLVTSFYIEPGPGVDKPRLTER